MKSRYIWLYSWKRAWIWHLNRHSMVSISFASLTLIPSRAIYVGFCAIYRITRSIKRSTGFLVFFKPKILVRKTWCLKHNRKEQMAYYKIKSFTIANQLSQKMTLIVKLQIQLRIGSIIIISSLLPNPPWRESSLLLLFIHT